MTNTFRISLTDLRHERLQPVFAAVEDACAVAGIDFYLVGAVARDIWMTGVYQIPTGRLTRDLDLALLVPQETAYWALRQRLLESGRFAEVRGAPVSLLYEGQITVDLMPFGALEVADGLVRLHQGFAHYQASLR